MPRTILYIGYITEEHSDQLSCTNSEKLIKRRVIKEERMEYSSDDGDMPVCPNGQYFNSSVLSFCILGVMEFEVS